MKLLIQIPCYNEEATLGQTLDDLPRSFEGVRSVEVLCVDDGSTDATVEVAKRHGADHVVSLRTNKGLASAFTTGLAECLARGADIIVNTDADNQYCSEDIQKLIDPIIAGKSQIVIGARPIFQIKEFSFVKRILQKIGSWVVRVASNTTVPDAPSGFRAFSREAAQQLNVFGEYTYTIETIIQAGQKGMALSHVPIRTNRVDRPSRLVRSIPSYISRSVSTILRIFMTYKPINFFSIPATGFLLVGCALGVRFLYYYILRENSGHIQSVVVAALCIGISAALFLVALLADLISVNRKLLEKVNMQQHLILDKLDQTANQPDENLPKAM